MEWARGGHSLFRTGQWISLDKGWDNRSVWFEVCNVVLEFKHIYQTIGSESGHFHMFVDWWKTYKAIVFFVISWFHSSKNTQINPIWVEGGERSLTTGLWGMAFEPPSLWSKIISWYFWIFLNIPPDHFRVKNWINLSGAWNFLWWSGS